jgi:hypothetical protein
VEAEQKLDDGAVRLSASAFLARYEGFRYIETRSGMKMSDKTPVFGCSLPRALFAQGTCEQDSKLAPLQGFSNRELQLLEPPLTHRKQTVAPRSNRELSTNQCSYNSRALVPRCSFLSGSLRSLSGLVARHYPLATRPVLTGSGTQTEIDVTRSKQTTEKFLTGARTHIRKRRIYAKISAQISSKLNAQMSEIR